MAKRLFVGNLPWSVDTRGLVELLNAQELAYSNAVVVNDRETGKSRGFGFVQFETDADYEAAISVLAGLLVENRALVANEANERPKRAVDRRQGSFKFSRDRQRSGRGGRDNGRDESDRGDW